MRSLFSFCLATAALLGFSRSQAGPAPDRIMVLISVDGLAHYYLDDPKAEMPMIRRLAAEGARAAKMKPVMPTVTWPNHTTLVTGVFPAKHGVIGNKYLDRVTGQVVELSGDPLFNKEEIVKAPTIYDVAKEGGLKTAAIAWPATRGASTLDWTVPFVFSNELFQRYGTPSLWAEFKQAGIAYETEAEGYEPGKGEARDELNVAMFNHVVRVHRPQLALLHILELDEIEHAYGPRSSQAYAAVKFADGCVRQVWENLNRVFPREATLILVSDHGFSPYWQVIQPNVIFRQAGLLRVDPGNVIVDARVRSVYQGGSTFIYVLDRGHRQALTARVLKIFAGVDGVDPPILPKDFARYGLPGPEENQEMPDIILSAKPGYSFLDTATGDIVVTARTGGMKGMHGYDPNNDEMNAVFVAWGAGIKGGTRIAPITNLDVTPTMARIMGLPMNNLDGHVLEGILK